LSCEPEYMKLAPLHRTLHPKPRAGLEIGLSQSARNFWNSPSEIHNSANKGRRREQRTVSGVLCPDGFVHMCACVCAMILRAVAFVVHFLGPRPPILPQLNPQITTWAAAPRAWSLDQIKSDPIGWGKLAHGIPETPQGRVVLCWKMRLGENSQMDD
jgi:hypothetical protein